jgi:hypothetical protein
VKTVPSTSEDELPERMENRFPAAQRSTRRLRLNFHSSFKRASWRTSFVHPTAPQTYATLTTSQPEISDLMKQEAEASLATPVHA